MIPEPLIKTYKGKNGTIDLEIIETINGLSIAIRKLEPWMENEIQIITEKHGLKLCTASSKKHARILLVKLTDGLDWSRVGRSKNMGKTWYPIYSARAREVLKGQND
jgi:hypothetical protein